MSLRVMWVSYERPVSLPKRAQSGFSVFRALLVPQMLNIYTMLKLRPLVYVLQVGRA